MNIEFFSHFMPDNVHFPPKCLSLKNFCLLTPKKKICSVGLPGLGLAGGRDLGFGFP